MMSKPNYSMIIIAVALVAAFSVANCNLTNFVLQARFSPERGLTCSRKSPRNGFPILSGATVQSTCLGATNTTTTDAAGSFILTLNFPTPTRVLNIRRDCDVIITLPANCTIIDRGVRVTFLRNDNRPRFRSIDTTVTGGSAVFTIEDFERA